MEFNPAVLLERIANMAVYERRLEAELARTRAMESQAYAHAAELTRRLTASQDVAHDAHAALRVSQVQVLNEQNQVSELIGFIKSFADRTGHMKYSLRLSKHHLKVKSEERRAPNSFIGVTYVQEDDITTIELHQGSSPAHVKDLRSQSRGLPCGEVTPVGPDYAIQSSNACRNALVENLKTLVSRKRTPSTGTCIILGPAGQATSLVTQVSLTKVRLIIGALMATSVREKIAITGVSINAIEDDMNAVVREFEARNSPDGNVQLIPRTPPPRRLAQA